MFHKRIRLGRNIYSLEGSICSITICTRDKIPFFKNYNLTNACIHQLRIDAESTPVSMFVYCFMPDHVHLVLSPHGRTNIIQFIAKYKSRTTRLAWRFGIKGRLWQKSFYDHFLRQEENVEHVVDYVLNNPVRKGLVAEWKEYPYVGSFVLDL